MIGPETSQLDVDTLVGRERKGKTRVVKGCPCYKEFTGLEKEKVCLNNDDVIPIQAISLDPSFFDQIESTDDLIEYKSDNEGMCYLLIYLDRKVGYCYCISQGQRIRINMQDVKTTEIDRALQFVTSTEKSRDGVICSDCLYKYLITLGEASEGYLSSQEREEIILSYVRDVSKRMAVELSRYSSNGTSDVEYEEHVKRYIKRINDTRSQWAALSTRLMDADDDINKSLLDLVNHYRTFYRLEAIFLSQVLSLDRATSETDALGTLKLMIGISEKVIQLCDVIREKTNYLIERKAMNPDLQERLIKHAIKRKETEYRFSNLVKILSEIKGQTT